MVGAVTGVLEGGLGSPLGAALGGAVLVSTLGAAIWVVRRWLETPVSRFRRLLGHLDEVVVLLHPNPDPDAMASAMAVAYIAESAGTTAHLQHAGEVRHPENRAFVSVFDLEMDAITDTNELACREVVLVDHNEPRGFAGAGGLTPLAVVDHHPDGGVGTRFTDVRPEYGACSTILAEYLRDQDADGIPTRLATALLFGIQSDTSSLTRGCSAVEFDVGGYLYEHADEARLERVATPDVDAEFLDVRAEAIVNRWVEEPFAVSDVGDVGNVDAIGAAADELVRLAGVRAVVVSGHSGNTLYMSGRARDDSIHVGEVLSGVVDDIPMSSAGGHARMGGGQVSVAHMHGIGPSAGISRHELQRRVLDALRAEA